MKQYGNHKSTSFTKKQISVIYAKAKNGELKVEKWVMAELYNLADYYGYDYNGSIEYFERPVLNIIENVFKNNIEEAQEQIDFFRDSYLSSLTEKGKKDIDRNLI